MTGRIQKHNVLPVRLDLISAYVLSDSSHLSCSYICLTDTIKERGLSMVYMPQESYNRSPIYHIFGLC